MILLVLPAEELCDASLSGVMKLTSFSADDLVTIYIEKFEILIK